MKEEISILTDFTIFALAIKVYIFNFQLLNYFYHGYQCTRT